MKTSDQNVSKPKKYLYDFDFMIYETKVLMSGNGPDLISGNHRDGGN